MELDVLLRRARASTTPSEPLYRTAADVWFECTDQLDSTDYAALVQLGLDAVRVSGSVPTIVNAVISGPALAAAIEGTAIRTQLSTADQEAFALLGFLTLLAEATIAEPPTALARPLTPATVGAGS